MSEDEKMYPAPPEYDTFKKRVRDLTGIDLNAYKYQIHRRVHMLMQRWNLTSYEEFHRILNTQDDKLREFLDYLTINVSEFFRNPAKFWEIRDKIFPEMCKIEGGKKLKIWSAGCATGEEPYSLGILCIEAGLTNNQPVLAADIDRGALEKAREGIYQIRQLANAPDAWKTKYFTKLDANTVQVKNDVKSKVNFKRMNLIEDKFDTGFDLILCRNVVIYFSPETKAALYHKFFAALRPGGYLVTGSTEQIFDYKKIGFESGGPFLYKRPL